MMSQQGRHDLATGMSDEIRAQIGEWWTAGLSGTECAKKLRSEYGLVKSRNSVIGVIYRLGLSGNRRQATHPKANRAKKAIPQHPRAPKPKAHYVKFERTPHIGDGPRPPRAELRARAWTPLEGFPPVRLEDRDHNGCKWPLEIEGAGWGEHWCCGRSAIGNYCETHSALATATPRTATEKRADANRRQLKLMQRKAA